MRCTRSSFPAVVALALVGCASSYHVVQIPERHADLYPRAQALTGVTIAVDEIGNAARAQRYFGADLIGQWILPVIVVVSNHGADRIVVRPADVLLYRGRDIIDPLPVEVVAAAATRGHWFLRSKTQAQVDDYFESVAFVETVLAANETYQGVMFFPIPGADKRQDAFFTVMTLFRQGGPNVRVSVTDLQTRERLHFGPFSIAFPEDRRRW